MNPINMLISLHRGYGVGDACQVSAVLRHVAKYRQNWHVDYQAPDGQHQAARGIVANHFAYGESYPSPHYDAEVQIVLYDTWAGWTDRPNTRVSSCLHELFGLPWDAECGRYQVNVSPTVKKWATDLVPEKSVAFHFQGDSSKARKDLDRKQSDDVCNQIIRLGHLPYIMGRHVPRGHDVEVNCAIIGQCRAFVGIDSGPSKCAAATDTPALVVWTGHHPACFFDPAPNTTHLVPRGYAGLYPAVNDQLVTDWFEAHQNVMWYENDPVNEVKTWLRDVLA